MDQPTTPSPPAAADDPDDELRADFALDLLEMTLDTMRVWETEDPAHLATRRVAVATALDSLRARHPIDQMFAAHAVASHHATMECFRRAMRATDNADVASRMHRNAVLLRRMMADAVKDLEHRQAPPTRRPDGQDRILGGKTP
ncbi:MAG TPA: hypothetical protein VKI44_26500 [Acetobacteraceae bacterium]|nr:hypothetical protein [Acetobacteraceae bacterium]